MYPSIFNRFPVIQPVISKVRHFSKFLHILASPGYAPVTIAVNVTWMERGFNAGQTHCSMYPPTRIFNRLRAIARYWSEIATFSYPSHLTPVLGCSHWNSEETFGPQKTRIMGLPGIEDSLTIGWTVFWRTLKTQTNGRARDDDDSRYVVRCVGGDQRL